MKKILSSFLGICLAVTLLIGAAGVLNAEPAHAASKKIHLKSTTVTVVAGKTFQQQLINKKGKVIKATKVKWKSKKTSVAKINKKGKITAVKAGTAKMTAKYKGKTYKFTVKVTKKGSSSSRPDFVKKVYNYVKSNGTSSDTLIKGDKWVVLGTETTIWDGELAYNTYGIGIINDDPSRFYLCMKMEDLEDSKWTRDCIDYISIEFNANASSGTVTRFQSYITSSDNFIVYDNECTINYANYTGSGGLSNYAKDDSELADLTETTFYNVFTRMRDDLDWNLRMYGFSAY